MNPASARKDSLVLVEWADINSGCEWEEPADLEHWEPAHCYSVGWIVKNTDEYLILIADHSPAGKHDKDKPGYGGHRVIPHGCIRKIRRIKL